MKRRLILSCFAALVVLSGCNMRAIEDIESAPLAAPANATLEQVKQGIIRGGRWKNWSMREAAPGHLVAETIVRGKHKAVVDIFFDTKAFSIRYKRSVNLRYDGRTIHKVYLDWIDELKRSIQEEVRLIKLPEPQDTEPRQKEDPLPLGEEDDGGLSL